MSKKAQKYIDKFNYTLVQPFTYASNGEMKTAGSLTIYAPNNKVGQWASNIEGEFKRSTLDFQMKLSEKLSETIKEESANKRVEEVSDEDKMDTMMLMLFNSGNVDKCMMSLEKILTYKSGSNAMCLVDDVEPMTSPLFQEISYLDSKNIMAKYVENFLSTSLTA